jgi:lipoprotein-anchoring transpeptidase ErfK/SrfK
MPIARLQFSSTVSATNLPPLTVTPRLSTKWVQVGANVVEAYANGAIAPMTSYVIKVPRTLHCASSCTFGPLRALGSLGVIDVSWEIQLLAELKYLPVSFHASNGSTLSLAQTPGTYTWNFPNIPPTLSAQWRPDAVTPIVTGALMTFQDQHHLGTTGVIDVATWRALTAAVAAKDVNPKPYAYVDVTTSLPETETLYVNGSAIFHAKVNTGIPYSPTALGTFPVYLRFVSQTMSGTNPDGSHYSDPGIPWVSYFNGGDALHGFIRATYGWPQSLGCVEQTFADAKFIYPYTPIGTLVTVRA